MKSTNNNLLKLTAIIFFALLISANTQADWSDAGKKSEDAVKEVGNATSETASDAWGKTKEVSSDAWDKTKGAAHDGADYVSEKTK